jgi:hypothetical protein
MAPSGGNLYGRHVHRRPVDPAVVAVVDPGALRRGTLAASVLDDIALEPSPDGVVVGAGWDDHDAWTPVSWHHLAAAVAGVDPESSVGRLRLRDWLRAYTLLTTWSRADPSRAPSAAPPSRVVALALPAGHALHPGPDWVVERVLGGVLEVGIGLRPDADHGVTSVQDGVAVPLPPGAADAAGVTTTSWWPTLRQQRDSMAVLAVDRLEREGRGVLRPIGGCDVLTLLSGRWLRDHLATADGTGMRAIAAPMRSRAWFDLARIDPAFVGAAAAATEPELRGAPRPLLVTVDEVTMRSDGAAPAELARAALTDPAGVRGQHASDVLYR